MFIRGLPKKSDKAVDQDSFKLQADAPQVGKGELHLACNEGTSVFKIQR